MTQNRTAGPRCSPEVQHPAVLGNRDHRVDVGAATGNYAAPALARTEAGYQFSIRSPRKE